jgi:hypothetical protein
MEYNFQEKDLKIGFVLNIWINKKVFLTWKNSKKYYKYIFIFDRSFSICSIRLTFDESKSICESIYRLSKQEEMKVFVMVHPEVLSG